jgi:hypothetical protein
LSVAFVLVTGGILAVLILGIVPHFPPLQGGLLLTTFLPGGLAATVTVGALWQAALKSEERSAIRRRFFKSKTSAPQNAGCVAASV